MSNPHDDQDDSISIFDCPETKDFISNEKFNQALQDQACDVVDSMLAKGYIPKPKSIEFVCENGNVYLLTKLLQYPMNIYLGMVTAIQTKHSHLLDHLYLAGVDINLPDKDGVTFLHWANDIETCQWLLDMGAKQVPDHHGETPLHWTCETKDETLVKLLLSREDGVQSICHRCSDNSTPLHWACCDSIEVVRLLLSYDQVVQSLSLVNDKGYTGLNLACSNKSPEIVELLLSYEQGVQTIPIADNDGNTPLHQACINNDIQTAKLLLSHKQGVQTISCLNNKGMTPLQISHANNYKQLVDLLNNS